MSIGMTTNMDNRYFIRPEYVTAYDLTVGTGPTFDLAKDSLLIAGTAVTLTAAEFNKLDGVTATTAELNFLAGVTAGTSAADKAIVLDSSSKIDAIDITTLDIGGTTVAATAAQIDFNTVTAGTAAASKAMVLDSSGDIIHPGLTTNTKNDGTVPSNATLVSYSGDGVNYTAVVTLSSLVITLGDNLSLGVGSLIFTLPAGDVLVTGSYISVSITLDSGTPTNDVPDSGLGNIQATGTITALSTTQENILAGLAAPDIAGGTLESSSSLQLLVKSGDAHTVYYNAADAWQDLSAGGAATLDGTVVITYTFLK